MRRNLLCLSALLILFVGVFGQYREPQFQRRANDPVTGIKNAQQKIGGFVNDLKTKGARPSTAYLTNYVTGIGGQIDYLSGVVGQVTSQSATGELSDPAIEEVIVPTFQSFTDAVEAFMGDVAGGIVDIGLVPALHSLSVSLAEVSNLAIKTNQKQYANKFDALKEQVRMLASKSSKFKHTMNRRSDDSITKAAQEVTYARQELEALISWFKSEGPPSKETVMQFVQSFEKELNDAEKSASDTMAGVGDKPKIVNSALLGPLFQSTTKGVEVLVSALFTTELDEPLRDRLNLISKQIDNVSALAERYQLHDYSTTLSHMGRKLRRISTARVEHKDNLKGNNPKAARHIEAILNALVGSLGAVGGSFLKFGEDLASGGENPSADLLVGTISGVDDQIDTLLGEFAGELSPFTFGLTTMAQGAILEPVFHVLSGTVDTIAGAVGGVADGVLINPDQSLGGSLLNVGHMAGTLNLDDLQMNFINQGRALILAAIKGQEKAQQDQS